MVPPSSERRWKQDSRTASLHGVIMENIMIRSETICFIQIKTISFLIHHVIQRYITSAFDKASINNSRTRKLSVFIKKCKLFVHNTLRRADPPSKESYQGPEIDS
jgi:hypothetical protein